MYATFDEPKNMLPLTLSLCLDTSMTLSRLVMCSDLKLNWQEQLWPHHSEDCCNTRAVTFNHVDSLCVLILPNQCLVQKHFTTHPWEESLAGTQSTQNLIFQKCPTAGDELVTCPHVFPVRSGVYGHTSDPCFHCGYGWHPDSGQRLEVSMKETCSTRHIAMKLCTCSHAGHTPNKRQPSVFGVAGSLSCTSAW